MESRSLQRRIMKELAVWAIAIGGAYLTFSSFEPLFDRAKAAASRAGFAYLFEFEQNSNRLARFNTKVLTTPSLPLRGTISAGQEQTGARKVVLSANDYGHFHAIAQIRGQEVEFMTDTGATYVALSYESSSEAWTCAAKFALQWPLDNCERRRPRGVHRTRYDPRRRHYGQGCSGGHRRARPDDAEPSRNELYQAVVGL